MARVYSTRFLFAALEEEETAEYVVPAGHVAVVRYLTISQTSSGAGGVVDFGVIDPSGDGLALLFLATTGQSSTASHDMRAVLNAGDTLVAQNDNEPQQSVIASGYLLSLP